MFVYQTRPDGVYVGIVEADESPLEPGTFLIPGGCVTVEPPSFGPPNQARWTGSEWVIEPAPVPEIEPEPTEPPEPTRLAKADLWRRLTDAEAVQLDGALAAAPVRLRRIFEAAAYLDVNDADYPALRAGVVAALGEARANEVLEPTE